jgi:S-adenosylmethionine:tRNA ribosyltransferase-isomerase
MRVADFDFDLPEDLIALRPVTPREAARLLVVRPGEGLEDLTVGDLPSLLRAGDALVFNDTRVIPARLDGRREARVGGRRRRTCGGRRGDPAQARLGLIAGAPSCARASG